MIVQSLSSGSSGNALFVQSGATRLLIDCGIGPRTLQAALLAHSTSVREINAVLLTHEHDDHVRGLAHIVRLGVPIHATEGTARAAGVGGSRVSVHAYGAETRIGNVSVQLMRTSHDAEQPCGFSICDGDSRVTLLTDLGMTDESYVELVAASDLLVIEANHDVHMLRSGPYPQHLKKRVLSPTGHLSNADCATFLRTALGESRSCSSVWLAHLSATNNRPQLAERTVEQSLAGAKIRPVVQALPRREPGPVWTPSARPVVAQLGLFDPIA